MADQTWTEPEDAPVEETEQQPVADEETQVAGEPAEDIPVEEAPEVTIAPAADADIDYPLVVSVANAGDILFEDENASVDVPPQVAEQVAYLTNVEVVA